MTTILRVHGTSTALLTLPVWLESYDVDAHDGLGAAQLTQDRDKALQFDDAGAALTAWKTQSTVRPLRADGKPNRPLTAFTVEPETL